MSGDPYRSAVVATAGTICRVCNAIMVTEGERSPLVCPHGCGEWYGIEAIRDHLCLEILSDRSEAIEWSSEKRDKPRCVVCDKPTYHFQLKTGSYCCCSQHGVWFYKRDREQILKPFAAQIKHQQEYMAEFNRILAVLQRGGDEAHRLIAGHLASARFSTSRSPDD